MNEKFSEAIIAQDRYDFVNIYVRYGQDGDTKRTTTEINRKDFQTKEGFAQVADRVQQLADWINDLNCEGLAAWCTAGRVLLYD